MPSPKSQEEFQYHRQCIRDVLMKPSWEYIDPLHWTVERLETFASNQELAVTGLTRVSHAEYTKLPVMVTAFFGYVLAKERPPTLSFFKDYYRALYHKEIPIQFFSSPAMKEGLNNRLARTYASIFRDLYFYHYLRESNRFQNVLYSVWGDITEGVDVYVQQYDTWFGLKLYTDTAKAARELNRKDRRAQLNTNSAQRPGIPDITIHSAIHLPIGVNKSTKAYTVPSLMDAWYLHHQQELEYVADQIDLRLDADRTSKENPENL